MCRGFSYNFASRMMLRFIILLTIALTALFSVEEEYAEDATVSAASGHILYDALNEETVQCMAGSGSLPLRLDVLRRLQRAHSYRVPSGRHPFFKVNVFSDVLPDGWHLMDRVYLYGAVCAGKVDFYIYWRNLRI